ncbi:MAG: sodium-translocating pyrophosphatase [Lentisphaeria bacterium]
MGTQTMFILGIIFVCSVVTLLYVWVLFRKVKAIEVKNKRIEEIGGYIEEGALAFLKREYKVIIPFYIVVSIFLACLGFYPGLDGAQGVGWQSAICFLCGGFFSGLAGFIGMKAAIKANSRTTYSAVIGGMPKALRTAFSGGAVLGLGVVGFGLAGLTALIFIFWDAFSLTEAVQVVAGYSLGCSMVALFARVGGGIYTKAADVGADLVGKVEAGIPEDDPRNPATIADNVGDNVGDIAGMGSDLTESYIGAIVSALAIGLETALVSDQITNTLFVLMICALGTVASLISVILIRSKEWHRPQRTLNFATYIAVGIVLVGTLLLSIFYLENYKAFFAVLSGIVVGILVGHIAERYTSSEHKVVQYIAQQSQTGHATNIIAGLSTGMQSTALTTVVLALGVIVSYVVLGDFGIGLAAVGMLSTVGITVSVDGYGPISDNAGGIAEMSKQAPEVRRITDKLDSVGNTTAAIGKGFCIGSATLTSLALFVAYAHATDLAAINIIHTQTMVGLLIGAMLPFLFASLTIKSVGKAANLMVEEVRIQFKTDPGILKGTSIPNYTRCVDISTKAALKEMVLPGIIAMTSPVIAGFLFGAEGLGGVLMGGLVSAIMLAVFMANAGGAWDNAKKYIEEGNYGGKGSEVHKASVTGDTVGDPLKDTAGPAMDILIKMMSIISLIIAPILANPNFTSLWDILVK